MLVSGWAAAFTRSALAYKRAHGRPTRSYSSTVTAHSLPNTVRLLRVNPRVNVRVVSLRHGGGSPELPSSLHASTFTRIIYCQIYI